MPKLRQNGYAFAGYTSSDYNILAQSGNQVSIVNKKWAEQEIERQAEIIRSAIRSRQTEIRLEGQYDDKNVSEYNYAFSAADRVGKEGYSVDGLTAGVDYTIEATIRHDSYMTQEWFEVEITYLNDDASASQPAA